MNELDTKNGKPFEASDEYLYQKKIEELNLLLDIATEALEFYAKIKWQMAQDDGRLIQLTEAGKPIGAIAREALERINEK